MRVPANLKEHYRIIADEGINIDRLFRNFYITKREKILRLYAAPLLKYAPTSFRYFITDIAKSLRNPSRILKLNYPMDFAENRKIAYKLKGDLKPWWGKKAVISFSHDIDNDKGYAFAEEMGITEYKAGIPATFNFLTHDNYSPDKLMLSRLKDMGMEIGLHGYMHDQGFAYRRQRIITKQLNAALSKIDEFEITGIRTPALSKSGAFFQLLANTGLKYDSSLQIGSGIYSSVRIPYPFFFDEYGIWEIPLMIQDDNYLRDSLTSEKDMLSSIIRFVEETIALNGVMVLNLHPHLMLNRSKLYHRILNVLLDYKRQVHFATTGMVCEYVEQQSK